MRHLFIYGIFLISFSIQGMTPYEEIIRSYQISKENKNLEKIGQQFEIIEKNKEGHVVYVLKEKEALFKKLAPFSKILEEDVNDFLKTNKSLSDSYHSFPEVKEEIKKLAKKYPELTKIVNYGKSKEGRPLFALKISDNADKDENEPKIMFTAATHGDELITVEVLLGLIKKLLNSYETDKRLRGFIENSEIYFIPVVNPDGFSKKSRYSANGTDPNRVYPWPKRPEVDIKVPCITHIMNFYNKMNFKGSIDFHAKGKMIMYPWGYTKERVLSSDYALFKKLTKSMARENRYKSGQISKIIYVAKGSSADYYYWKNNGLALGVELTTSKYPRASRIPKVIKEAEEMTWTYLDFLTRP